MTSIADPPTAQTLSRRTAMAPNGGRSEPARPAAKASGSAVNLLDHQPPVGQSDELHLVTGHPRCIDRGTASHSRWRESPVMPEGSQPCSGSTGRLAVSFERDARGGARPSACHGTARPDARACRRARRSTPSYPAMPHARESPGPSSRWSPLRSGSRDGRVALDGKLEDDGRGSARRLQELADLALRVADEVGGEVEIPALHLELHRSSFRSRRPSQSTARLSQDWTTSTRRAPALRSAAAARSRSRPV